MAFVLWRRGSRQRQHLGAAMGYPMETSLAEKGKQLPLYDNQLLLSTYALSSSREEEKGGGGIVLASMPDSLLSGGAVLETGKYTEQQRLLQ